MSETITEQAAQAGQGMLDIVAPVSGAGVSLSWWAGISLEQGILVGTAILIVMNVVTKIKPFCLSLKNGFDIFCEATRKMRGIKYGSFRNKKGSGDS